MSTDTPAPAPQGPISVTVALEQPIVRGTQTIDVLTVRKPMGGELRGVTLVDLGQLDVSSLIKVLPRVCSPMITEADVAGMDPGDLTAVGSEVAHFLLTTGRRASLGL